MELILLIIALVIVSGWIGLRIRPRAFPAYFEQTPPFKTIPLPDDLPEPVQRFYRKVTGDSLPLIHSAVITLSGSLRLGPITFPARMRFTHRAGYDYRHYLETTLFGIPLLKVNERYLDGVGRMELPFGTIEDEPKINLAANLAVWGESMWLSPIFITDERVRWHAEDDRTARLIVPYEHSEDEPEQVFTVHFDPETHLLTRMETMRYREAQGERICWILDAEDWREQHGILVPMRASVTWEDQGTPWLIATVEDIAFNVDVSDYIQQRGL